MLVKKIALGFGIAIIFPMMIHFGVNSFSPPPDRSDYQVEDYHQRYREAGPEQKEALKGRRDRLEEQLVVAQKTYQRASFFTAVPFGLAAIILGAYLPQIGLGSGLMFGGIFSVCHGYVNNWNALGDSLKFASMVVAFALLLYLAYKKIETKEEA